MYCAFALAVFKLVRAGDIIVAKTDPRCSPSRCFLSRFSRRAKLVNWLQDLYPEVAIAFGIKAMASLSPILKPLRDMSLKKAQHNVAIGDHMKERLLSLGVPAERFPSFIIGAPTNTFARWIEAAILCAQLGPRRKIRRRLFGKSRSRA